MSCVTNQRLHVIDQKDQYESNLFQNGIKKDHTIIGKTLIAVTAITIITVTGIFCCLAIPDAALAGKVMLAIFATGSLTMLTVYGIGLTISVMRDLQQKRDLEVLESKTIDLTDINE